MQAAARQFRPLLQVGLPVAVAVVLVCLAVLNMALVKTWPGEPEDGVLWQQAESGGPVVAAEVAVNSAGHRAGIHRGDHLWQLNGREVTSPKMVDDALHAAVTGARFTYHVTRQSSTQAIAVELQPMPALRHGLYYSLALVGVLSIVVGSSVRLRRPNDPATLHFFWLAVALFGVLAFSPSGRYDTLDYFFDWADAIARFVLPPLFLHFAFVFPDRPNPWAKSEAGRAVVPSFYLPAMLLAGGRIVGFADGLRGPQASVLLQRIETASLIYLAVCLLGGLAVMLRALTRLRSVTARRQLRWIVWGLSVGALPFVTLYLVPFLFGWSLSFGEYTAVLLGCIPLAFASAIVRYRLMDIEVIIKKALVVSTVVVVLMGIYLGTVTLVGFIPGADQSRSQFWAMLATLVVALVAPWLRTAIQSGLDRLYYRDRYDYRRALMSFARDLNSDLDLDRLTSRLVERVSETLGVEHMALFMADPRAEAKRFTAVAVSGYAPGAVPGIEAGSMLGAKLVDGQAVVLDDPLPMRRLIGDESTVWREAGLTSFVPCVAKDSTIAVLAAGRRPHGEPLNSEDLVLVSAVASQAATAIENARLYGELRDKANEIERLRQFGDSVVESLSDGLVVVDLDDRVLRWNKRVETLIGIARDRAVGRRLSGLFNRPFVDTLMAARREAPAGTQLYRVPVTAGQGDAKRDRLVNLAVAPFQTAEATQAGWIIVLEDVTDRANLEEQLRLSEKMAAIGLLAAGVAHEVNTPLTGISSFTQMLLERAAPGDPRTELLEKIERQTFRAAKIVSSLLNLARPSGGETGPVDLNVVVGDVLSLLEHQFRMSKVQVRRDLTESPVVVRGVEYKLQQVFLNLLLNARDAMPKGGWVSVATRADGGEALVEVADTGAGIPSEHLARIYDPFFTTKPEGGGTGLGLSVTYGIVQEHGGKLLCESDVGQGTRFKLVLPLMEPAVVGGQL
jgi:PAS domain S-box-containing protein